MTTATNTSDVREMRQEVQKYDEEKLIREITFARAFGVYDELSRTWLEELESEAAKRWIIS